MAISIFFLLFLFGCGGGLLLLIVAAIATRRIGVLAVGIALAALLGCGLLWMISVRSTTHYSNVQFADEVIVSGSPRFVYPPSEVAGASEPAIVHPPSTMQYIDDASGSSHTITHGTHDIGSTVTKNYLLRLPFLIVLIMFVVAMLARNGSSPTIARLFRRGWAFIPIVIIFGIFGLFFTERSSTRTYTVTPPRSTYPPRSIENHNIKKVRISESERAGKALLAQQKHLEETRRSYLAGPQSAVSILAQQKHLEETRRAQQKHLQDTLRAQQKHVEATMLAQQKQIAKTQADIRAEIDQFDAPRIPLPPAAPAAADPIAQSNPAAKADKKAAANEKPAAKVVAVDVRKVAAATAQPGKEAGQLPARTETKQSEPTSAKSVKKDVAASTQPDMIAEADPDKPLPRPAWVDEPPKRTGGTRREVVATDLYESVDECYQAADVFLLLKAYQRMQQLTEKPFADAPLPSITFKNVRQAGEDRQVAFFNGEPYWTDWRIRVLANMGIGADYVRRVLVAKDEGSEPREYLDTVQRSFGPMKKLYLQTEFSSAVDSELRQLWDAYQRRERFAIAGVGAGTVVSLIAVLFALLKIDTWTKGYYTKRLFIGVPAAIIAVSTLLWVDPLQMF